MSWFVVLLLVMVFVVALGWLSRPLDGELDEATYHAAVELHTIRRRVDVARLKAEMRADAARLRRELRDELDGSDSETWDVPR